MIANVDVSKLRRKYRSEVERQFGEEVGQFVLYEYCGKQVAWMGFEDITFNLPTKYTPDFPFVLQDGRCGFVEVKNSRKQKGYRATRTKLVAAAYCYPWFLWLECVKEQGWAIEEIQPE